MKEPFEELIAQLSTVLEVDLHLDHNHIVALKIRDRLAIQLQEDREKRQVLIVSMLCEVPPGRFRENVCAEALKANSSAADRPGTLGYLAMKNALTLHLGYPIEELDGKKLALLTSNFIDCAEQWQKAIDKGQVGPS